mmetsp:Transcript_17552/g.44569  ORF Transcript_17552/g.44569 Transcript_17552/m.44569 type:complete len:594 (+) Transcript_17552:220-2001(+)|eukprot:jgi/Tetstr1/461696/TSEL_006796.t1
MAEAQLSTPPGQRAPLGAVPAHVDPLMDECPGCGWPRPRGACAWCRSPPPLRRATDSDYDLEHFFGGGGVRLPRLTCSPADKWRGVGGWQEDSGREDAWEGLKRLMVNWQTEAGEKAGRRASAGDAVGRAGDAASERPAMVDAEVQAAALDPDPAHFSAGSPPSRAEALPGAKRGEQSQMYSSASTFEELPLSKELLDGLYTEMKFERPSVIQALTLPMVLRPPFKHLIAQAHNGSGKTTCFALAMLSRVDLSVHAPQALCLCPTRELALQHLAVLQKIAKYTGARCTSTASPYATARRAAGGGRPKQRTLTHQIIIGTHGKIKSWVSKRLLSFGCMQLMVFDEADEMLKGDGFADDSLRLIKGIKKQSASCQVLLFSATFNDRVKRFAEKVLPDANKVFVPKEELSLDVVQQCRVDCPTEPDKVAVLTEMVLPNCEHLGQTIIFVKSRVSASLLCSELARDGYTVTAIHGEMANAARNRAVQEFRDGATKVLIATDVLARGFDVSQVTLVVNFDIPSEWHAPETPAYETYLHRIGRSGRFGRRGAAFNLASGPQENTLLDLISGYFAIDMSRAQHNDEDAVLEVLEAAGLRG